MHQLSIVIIYGILVLINSTVYETHFVSFCSNFTVILDAPRSTFTHGQITKEFSKYGPVLGLKI